MKRAKKPAPAGIPASPHRPLVAQSPAHSPEAESILETIVTPSHPYMVTYYPKWDGEKFTMGTVVCQHGRHRTIEGAARCAAAHGRALRGKAQHFAVRIQAAPSVMWKTQDGRRHPRVQPAGD